VIFMSKTKIEWADRVWNPATGCTKVSAGCEHCYAARMAARFECGPFHDVITGGKWNGKVQLHHNRLEQPLRWKKSCRIFVNSMGDLFHPSVPDDYLEKVFRVMDQCGAQANCGDGNCGHQFMILTKRPERMRDFVGRWWKSYHEVGVEPYADNIWLGVTAENQAAADERIPILLKTPAAMRFVSVEPMLEPVNLETHLGYYAKYETRNGVEVKPKLDWVICGGETGPGARPMDPLWVCSLLDQCRITEVPFFFKSWGEWGDSAAWGRWCEDHGTKTYDWPKNRKQGIHYRVGRKAAGREIGGHTFDEFPKEMK